MNVRLAAWLTGAGLVGVLSLLLIPIEDFILGTALPAWGVRSLAIVQPAILTVILVVVGTALAPRVGLRAPAFETWIKGEPALPVLDRQARPAALVAIAVALLLLAYSLLVVPRLMEESPAVARFAETGLPLVTRILYGGITEELLTRWGLMSLFVWAAWRLSGSPARVAPWSLWLGVALAAALFAAGHVPLLFSLMGDPPAWAVAAVFLGNALPGLLFGWLFWRYGLEAAMLAHAGAHLLAAPLDFL